MSSVPEKSRKSRKIGPMSRKNLVVGRYAIGVLRLSLPEQSKRNIITGRKILLSVLQFTFQILCICIYHFLGQLITSHLLLGISKAMTFQKEMK